MPITKTSDSVQFRYSLTAQDRDNQLTIEIIGENLFLRKTAQEIISNPALIAGFPPEQAAVIGYIAGSEN